MVDDCYSPPRSALINLGKDGMDPNKVKGKGSIADGEGQKGV